MIRIPNRVRAWLERQLVRGAQYRILVVAALIGLISVAGGVLVLALGSGFAHLGEAVWWAFLRLTDPGYLGDDVGTVNRVISTVLTVLGYVVFLGALVAIMTQWLHARMAHLEHGLTPVSRQGHVLVLGWTNRTEAIVRELLLSEGRVRRFLRRRGVRRLHIVVLAREVTALLVQDLRDSVGGAWDEGCVTLRSGTALRPDHLERVAAASASAVVIPGSEFGEDAGRADTHTIKTLLSLGQMTGPDGQRPLVVTEIFEAKRVPLARHAYPGEIEVVASDAVVSRLLAQNIRHGGLSLVYNELLTHGRGSEIYIRDAPEVAGQALHELHGRFPEAVLLGVTRPLPHGFRPVLNVEPDFRVQSGDRLVLLAESYEATRPLPAPAWQALPRVPAVPSPSPVPGEPRQRRVLVLGWNHKVPALIREFGTYADERFQVRIVSTVAMEERRRALRGFAPDPARIEVEHLEADYTDQRELAAVDPAAYDGVVLVGSDWLESHEESDARTLMGFLMLERLLLEEGRRPAVIVELLDPENVRLLSAGQGEVIISPLILSHMLAQIALRRELRSVFDELFTAGGAEITFRPLELYAPAGATVSFAELERAAAGRGETALGVRVGAGPEGLRLNPRRDARWTTAAGMEVVVLANE